MIVTALVPVEVELLCEGSYSPGQKMTWDDPGWGPEVEVEEVSSVFVSIAGKQFDLLAGVDRKSDAFKVFERHLMSVLGEHMEEALRIEGDNAE